MFEQNSQSFGRILKLSTFGELSHRIYHLSFVGKFAVKLPHINQLLAILLRFEHYHNIWSISYSGRIWQIGMLTEQTERFIEAQAFYAVV
jgi:hypothetical protein